MIQKHTLEPGVLVISRHDLGFKGQYVGVITQIQAPWAYVRFFDFAGSFEIKIDDLFSSMLYVLVYSDGIIKQ